jgi:hypothetical protein
MFDKQKKNHLTLIVNLSSNRVNYFFFLILNTIFLTLEGSSNQIKINLFFFSSLSVISKLINLDSFSIYVRKKFLSRVAKFDNLEETIVE